MYVSVFGDERGKEVAIAGLKSKAKYVRSELGKRMKLRLTPEIRFLEDESFERGSRVKNQYIQPFFIWLYMYVCVSIFATSFSFSPLLSFSLSSLSFFLMKRQKS